MATSVMRKYEGLFLVDSAIAAANWDTVIQILQTIMNRAGAEVLSQKKWDDRRLCYPINGHTRGTYVLIYFNAPTTAIAGVERDVQISDEILRVMILAADRIPDEVVNALTPCQLTSERGEYRQEAGGAVAEVEEIGPELPDAIETDLDGKP